MSETLASVFGLEVVRTTESDGAITMVVAAATPIVERLLEENPCPYCGNVSLIKYGTSSSKYRDLPVDGKPVVIEWKRRRFKCLNTTPLVPLNPCGRTFFERNAFFEEKHQVTARLLDHIGAEALSHPFSSIAEATGVDNQTIRNAFGHWSESRRIPLSELETPLFLALKTIHVLGRDRTLIANIEEETIVDLVADQQFGSIKRVLSTLKNPELVRIVRVDLSGDLLASASEVFPESEIVVDRGSVIRRFEACFDIELNLIRARLVRDRVRWAFHKESRLVKSRREDLTEAEIKSLERWFKLVPDLRILNAISTAFLKFAGAYFPDDADRALKDLEEAVEQGTMESLRACLTEITKYRNYVLDGYRLEPSGFDDAVVDFEPVINDRARGHTFAIRRANVLAYGGAFKVSGLPVHATPHAYLGDPAPRRTGVHMPTLSKEWEEMDSKR